MEMKPSFRTFLATRPDLQALAERFAIPYRDDAGLFKTAAGFAILRQQEANPGPGEIAADIALVDAILADFEAWCASPEAIAAEKQEQAAEQAVQLRNFKTECSHARDRLAAQIGAELVKRIDPRHPNLDWPAARQVIRHRIYKTNLLIYGPPGTGKSRALAHLALRLAATGWQVAWITGTEFGEVVANIGDPQERVRALQRLDELATAEVLLIDDLGSAHFSEARVSRLFELLDARYRNQLPTAVSTNSGSDELRRQLAGQSRDPGSKLVADRIIRRLTGSPADPRATFVRFAPKPRQSKANPST
jgi:hypothetical protein